MPKKKNETRVELTQEFLEQSKADGKTFNDLQAETGWGQTVLRKYASKYNIVLDAKKHVGRIIDVTGQRFGSLRVVKRLEGNYGSGTAALWLLECDCGNFRESGSSDFRKGVVHSCGCAKRDVNFKGVGEFGSVHFYHIVQNAKSRKIDFNLSKEFLWNLYLKQDRLCPLSGVPIKFYHRGTKKDFFKDTTCSLDRIDPLKHYDEDNVQWIHKDVNAVKLNLQEDEFFKICKLVHDNHNKSYARIDYYPVVERKSFKGLYEIDNQYWKEVIKCAKKRSKAFDITREQVWELYLNQGMKCALTGLDISFYRENTDLRTITASIDRIDPQVHYVIDNIQLIYKPINNMKQSMMQEDFINWCTVITEYQKTKKEQAC
jgi:hypothetical protein